LSGVRSEKKGGATLAPRGEIGRIILRGDLWSGKKRVYR